jgi:tetratricopeptide (TPR) repeat protein
MSTRIILAVLVAGVGLGGCGRTYRVPVTLPAPAFADRSELVLTGVTTDAACAAQLRLLFTEAFVGQQRWRERPAATAGEGALHLELAVGRWELLPDGQEVWRDRLVKDAGPMRSERERLPVRLAEVELVVTVRTAAGGMLLPPTQVAGRAYGHRGPPAGAGWSTTAEAATVTVHAATESELVNLAMLDALGPILRLLAEDRRQVWLELDGEDPAQAEALAQAAAGDVEGAVRRLLDYQRWCPRSASAAYNLGCLHEALGRIEEALRWYTQACGLDGREEYRRGHDRCRRTADILRGDTGVGWL